MINNFSLHFSIFPCWISVFPYQPVSSPKSNGYLCQTVVHIAGTKSISFLYLILFQCLWKNTSPKLMAVIFNEYDCSSTSKIPIYLISSPLGPWRQPNWSSIWSKKKIQALCYIAFTGTVKIYFIKISFMFCVLFQETRSFNFKKLRISFPIIASKAM